MKENFDLIFDKMIKHEGGYVNHPRDPGGATNLGVTIGTLSDYLGRKATIRDVKALTKEAVRPIYRSMYWDKIKGDDLPSGVDYAVFDFAVNSGPARAAISLQRGVGVADDGNIGKITLAAVRKLDPKLVIDRVCNERLSFMSRLKNWPTFKKGWISRVNSVELNATKMVKE